MTVTPEQQARDLLERMGIEKAQSFTAGDVVELSNLIAEVDLLRYRLKAERRYFGRDDRGRPRRWKPSTA